MIRRYVLASMLALLAPAIALAETPSLDAGLGCAYHRDCPCGMFCYSGFCRTASPPASFTMCSVDNDCNTACTGTVCVSGRCERGDSGHSFVPDAPDATVAPDSTVSDPPVDAAHPIDVTTESDVPARPADVSRPNDVTIDASTGSDGSTSTSSDGSTASPAPEPEGGASCATAPTRVSSRAGAFGLAVLAIVALRRRRARA